ncbi:hypothetical protein GCM10023258_22330 [Terrabacter aeriphilus]|uniref:MinD-like ATPase involved in chromosome partitioning or flagellar assembly n=1 Tax=Terrabacter aeriphilus TaxID=515662 RepID=A0ABP9JDT6_9MICO
MSAVLTALGHRWESVVATVLEDVPDVTIARRCADVAELLSVAEAGLGEVAVVSADLRGLDLDVVHRLRALRLRVVGVHPAEDEAAERRLRQLSVTTTVSTDADAQRWAEALAGDGDGRQAPQDPERPGGDAAPSSGRADALAGPSGWRPAGAGPVTDPSEGDGEGAGPAGPDDRRRASGAGGAGGAPDGGPERGHDGDVHDGDVRDGRDDACGADMRGGSAGDDGEERARRTPVLAVWGPTGAPGRTTIATTLAAELAARGVSCLLVDADTYGGSVAQTLGLLDEAPGIAAACRAADHGTLDLPALSRVAPEVTAGLRVLTGLPKAERWPELRAAALERVLELSRLLVQVVVVDCGFCLEDDAELSYDTLAPRRNEATLTALSVSDVVVAVGGADPVALQRLVRGLQELGTVPSGTPVTVVNRVRSGAVGSRPEARIADSLLRFAGLTGVRFVPDEARVLDDALLAGRSVVEHAPDSAVRHAVAELATALLPWTAPGRGATSGSRGDRADRGSRGRRWAWPSGAVARRVRA